MPGLNLTRDEAVQRSHVVVAQASDIHLDLTGGPDTFRTTARLTFRALPGESTFVDAVTETLHSITLNGRQLDANTCADQYRIQLNNLQRDNVLEVEADFAYSNTGEGLHRFEDPTDGEVYLYTQFEVPDARRVFPTFEQPDLKQSFTFTVDAPAHWTVISNQQTPEPTGLSASASGAALARWSFSATPRISSYITALVAGPYRGVTDTYTAADGRSVPLGLLTRASLFEHLDPQNLFATTKAGFAFYEKQFGTPYPFAKYDQVFVPEFNAGAMENAACVTILEDYVFRSRVSGALRERRDITVLHELAHMWFGDLVTMRWWDDLWLNESFAEFMSHLCAVDSGVSPHAWTTFAASEKSWAYSQDQLPTTHPITANMVDLDAVQANFDGITYAKGASVLRQLVAWVGQEEFMAGVRAYLEENAWGNAELADLMRQLEKSSGRDLSGWTSQWLETSGVNTLSVFYDIDDDGYLLDLMIRQKSPKDHPHLRQQRVKLGFFRIGDSGALELTDTLQTDIEGAETPVPAATGMPIPDLVLINQGDLGYAKVRLDDASLETALGHVSALENSLDRAVVWTSLWDSTRDGDLPASLFVDAILTHLPSETDVTLAMRLLRQLQYAITHFVRPAKASSIAIRAGNVLWGAAQEAQGGSDIQFQLVSTFALVARTEMQLETVADLRSGETSLSGLSVDQDLSWALLISLAAGGHASEEQIRDAEKADPTATGATSAATARAAIPEATVKQSVWESLVHQRELSNTMQRATIDGFRRAHDPQLLRPFAQAYFEALPHMWDETSYETSQRLVTGLYPSWPVAQATVEATDQALETHAEALPGLRRPLLEARDHVARSLCAQAADEAAQPQRPQED